MVTTIIMYGKKIIAQTRDFVFIEFGWSYFGSWITTLNIFWFYWSIDAIINLLKKLIIHR